MTNIIKSCRSEKKKGIRAIDGLRKLLIPDSEIPKCPKLEVKSEIWKLFINEKILEEYSTEIYKIDPYFYEHHREKVKVEKNACEYILFRINVYFTEYILAVEIVEQNHEDRDLVFEKKGITKRLGCMFIRINNSNAKNGFNTDYEVGKVQIFISKLKENKLKNQKMKK